MNRRQALAFLALGAAPTFGRARPVKDVACWGDSITNLYAAHLQRAFPQRRVYNGGVVGQTSEWRGSAPSSRVSGSGE